MKTITVKKYVAFDGSTFTNEKDCIEYENNAVALTNILDACRVIKSLEHYSPKFFNDEDNIPTYSDLTTPFTTLDKKYSWIFIADNKEFDKVKHALMHDLPNSYLVKHIQPPSAYPDILVVEQSKSNSRSSSINQSPDDPINPKREGTIKSDPFRLYRWISSDSPIVPGFCPFLGFLMWKVQILFIAKTIHLRETGVKVCLFR